MSAYDKLVAARNAMFRAYRSGAWNVNAARGRYASALVAYRAAVYGCECRGTCNVCSRSRNGLGFRARVGGGV